MLAVLLVLAAGAAAALTRLARGSRGERSDAEPAGTPTPARARGGARAPAHHRGAAGRRGLRRQRRERAREGATAQRLSDVGSNRYDYWEVALGQFAADPSARRRERLVRGGVAARARDRRGGGGRSLAPARDRGRARADRPRAAGRAGGGSGPRRPPLVAGGSRPDERHGGALTVWAVHACLDWDWEMPRLTLVAVVLAGALLAVEDLRDELSAPPSGLSSSARSRPAARPPDRFRPGRARGWPRRRSCPARRAAHGERAAPPAGAAVALQRAGGGQDRPLAWQPSSSVERASGTWAGSAVPPISAHDGRGRLVAVVLGPLPGHDRHDRRERDREQREADGEAARARHRGEQ